MGARKSISMIQVPFGLGAARPGTEDGPESMIRAGLIRHIRTTAYEIASEYKLKCPAIAASPSGNAPLKYLPEVKAMCRLVAERVSQAVRQGHVPLVLGGDHSVTMGVLAGLAARLSNPGVIYFAAHAGLNTEETSITGYLNRMPLAVALGLAQLKLVDITGVEAGIKKENVVIIGLREIDVRSSGIWLLSKSWKSIRPGMKADAPRDLR